MTRPDPVVLNDVHSRLNRTEVAEYLRPASRADLVAAVFRAKEQGRGISISGGAHAMGGQQFGDGTIHLNLSDYSRVIRLDEERGLVTVESGIQWPELIAALNSAQPGREDRWVIRQKQTGADRLSLGGALSANVHGRGLSMKPFVADVEGFELIGPEGKIITCRRDANAELFSLAIGGYGLFGIIAEVTLRLARRVTLERKVELLRSATLPDYIERRIQDGFLYGDYQFKTDERAEDFLSVGIVSCYRPATAAPDIPKDQRALSEAEWEQLYQLAHLDKDKAFEMYAVHYLATDGQLYGSDTHQLSYYVAGLDDIIDRQMGSRAPGSLMITELYVPRAMLPAFLQAAAFFLRERKANLVYGTVRWIEKDDETFLPWAQDSFACVVMNLRVLHDPAGLEAAQGCFQGLIDLAVTMGGTYFLTYHRWARKDQVLRAHPRFPEFLRRKRLFDPEGRFHSDWYRSCQAMLGACHAP